MDTFMCSRNRKLVYSAQSAVIAQSGLHFLSKKKPLRIAKWFTCSGQFWAYQNYKLEQQLNTGITNLYRLFFMTQFPPTQMEQLFSSISLSHLKTQLPGGVGKTRISSGSPHSPFAVRCFQESAGLPCAWISWVPVSTTDFFYREHSCLLPSDSHASKVEWPGLGHWSESNSGLSDYGLGNVEWPLGLLPEEETHGTSELTPWLLSIPLGNGLWVRLRTNPWRAAEIIVGLHGWWPHALYFEDKCVQCFLGWSSVWWQRVRRWCGQNCWV